MGGIGFCVARGLPATRPTHAVRRTCRQTIRVYDDAAPSSQSSLHQDHERRARRLRELTVAEVDAWLSGHSKVVSTSTLRVIQSALNRSIKRAMAQDKVKRNVVELVTLPKGREGRRSKSLTLAKPLRSSTPSRGPRCTPTSWSLC